MDWILSPSLRRLSPRELPDCSRADQVAEKLLEETGHDDAEVSILLTDDPGIHVLNKQWRNYDKPTDVLSWPQEDPIVLGDVAISLDTARVGLAARGWAVEEEIALLLVHGILHLLGHEDETEAGAEGMRIIERRLLGKPLEKVPGT